MRTEVIVRYTNNNRIHARYWLLSVVPRDEAMTNEQRAAAFGYSTPARYGAPVAHARLLCHRRLNASDETYANEFVMLTDPLPTVSQFIDYVQHEDLPPLPLPPLPPPDSASTRPVSSTGRPGPAAPVEAITLSAPGVLFVNSRRPF